MYVVDLTRPNICARDNIQKEKQEKSSLESKTVKVKLYMRVSQKDRCVSKQINKKAGG